MSHERFFKMLDRVPRIRHLWLREPGEIDCEAFEAELGVMSSGEAHMARFFASVWFNQNSFTPPGLEFDLVDALASIDKAHADLIIEWINDPFWP